MFFTGVLAGDRPPRYGKKSVLLTVGRGPVPRRASVGKTAWVGVRFSRRSHDRGGQAPALRAKELFASLCAVREQASPNYSLLKVLKDLKRCFDGCDRGGQAPALRLSRPPPFHRRARACPSPCLGRNGKTVGWRAVFARVERSRGTDPRATGQGRVLFAMRRSGAGKPEL